MNEVAILQCLIWMIRSIPKRNLSPLPGRVRNPDPFSPLCVLKFDRSDWIIWNPSNYGSLQIFASLLFVYRLIRIITIVIISIRVYCDGRLLMPWTWFYAQKNNRGGKNVNKRTSRMAILWADNQKNRLKQQRNHTCARLVVSEGGSFEKFGNSEEGNFRIGMEGRNFSFGKIQKS